MRVYVCVDVRRLSVQFILCAGDMFHLFLLYDRCQLDEYFVKQVAKHNVLQYVMYAFCTPLCYPSSSTY